MARSCATRDDSNKDNVCTPTISAGINRPPPCRPSRIYPECRAIETRLTVKDSFSGLGPCERVSFIYDGEVGPPPKAKGHRWRRTARSDGTGRRRDPTNKTTRAGAEDAEYRRGSDTKEVERLLLET